MHKLLAGIALLLAATHCAWGGKATILEAIAQNLGNQRIRFIITVEHAHQDWDHYADRWEVLTPDGQLLATRTLHHPHVNEQPFTRQLDNVRGPESVASVTIRAHDGVHGYGGAEIELKLPQK
jgi:hypothetical protein